MKDLRALGYTVARNAGSHGPWDITAVGPAHVKLVQVKAEGQVSRQAMFELSSFSAPKCVHKELWERVRGEWIVRRER